MVAYKLKIIEQAKASSTIKAAERNSLDKGMVGRRRKNEVKLLEAKRTVSESGVNSESRDVNRSTRRSSASWLPG